MQKILWIDNDRFFLRPRVQRLQTAGYKVVQKYSVSEAEKLLNEGESWDLVIIDPMMNISQEEEKDYPPSETDSGLKAGLVFFKRNQDRIRDIGAQVVVFTSRDDQEIVDDFMELGLPREKVKNKMDAADAAVFLAWIEEVLGKKTMHA